MFTITSVAASHVGKVRDNNEDNYFINGKIPDPNTTDMVFTADESKGGLYAVCDGMGGEECGEVASEIAVNTLHKFYRRMLEQGIAFDKLIDSYIDEANTQICDEIEKSDGKRMGTTFAVLYIKNEIAHVYNIGDSRVYLLRNNLLSQLSCDHTQIKRLIDMGILTAEKAKTHPERHMLTQHLGIFPDEMVLEPFVANPLTVEDNDMFLLCSDGLTDMLEDKAIEEIMRDSSDPQKATKKLIDAALQNGGKDNVTVIVVEAERKDFGSI